MEAFSACVPKVVYIGDPAAPGAHALTWLAQQCDIRSAPETAVVDTIADLESVDVVLLDVHSIHANLNCRQLRHEEVCRHLPVLGLGHRLPAQDIVRLLRNGAVDVIALPTDYEILLAKIISLAHRHMEVTMTTTVNRKLIQDVEGLRAALQGVGQSSQDALQSPGLRLPGVPTASAAGASVSRESGQDLLQQLAQRTDALPDQVALFVISLLASTEILPLNLSSLILNSLTRRVPICKLGPVHHALADLVKRHMAGPRPSGNNAEMAMLHACAGSAQAIQALRFVVDLPSLLTQTVKAVN